MPQDTLQLITGSAGLAGSELVHQSAMPAATTTETAVKVGVQLCILLTAIVPIITKRIKARQVRRKSRSKSVVSPSNAV